MEIIIVDDEPVSLTLLKQLVAKLPHCQPKAFTDPAAALAWCRANDPDVVIVDYMMPGVNGIEFARCLSALEGRAETPLLMVSATADNTVRTSALENGIDSFMRKPVSFAELQTRVAEMVTLRSKQIRSAKHAVLLAVDPTHEGSAATARAARLLHIEATLDRLAGDEMLFARIARVFVDTVPQLLSAIKGSLASNCLDNAYSDAHSLKGAAGAFEAPELMDAIVLLEKHARTYNGPAAIAAYAVVEPLCRQLIDELKASAASGGL